MTEVALLNKVPILQKLTVEDREYLAEKLDTQSFPDKADIIVQGDEGHGFYIIKSGRVIVKQRNLQVEHSDFVELAQLGQGDFFGETALLTEGKRGATVVADGPVECLYLARTEFLKVFGAGDTIKIKFAKRMAISGPSTATLANTSNKNAYVAAPLHGVKEKDAKVKKLIMNAIRFTVLFMNLDPDHSKMVVDQMWRKEVKQGVDIVTQDHTGDNLYVVESGEFHCFVHGDFVAMRGPGACFGELALMYNSPRMATVTAMADSVVWVVDRYTFRRIVTGMTQHKLSDHVAFLARVELLAPLASFEREKLAEALEEVTFQKDHVLFKQGDAGDAMYLVVEGEWSIVKNGEEVMVAKPGDYFGERALLRNEPRAATVTCKTSGCRALRLDRNGFDLLLGPLSEIMDKKIEDFYDGQKTIKAGKLNKNNVIFENLKTLGTLGKGSFGHVTLVQCKKTNMVYALKAVNKVQLQETNQGGHIMSEKNIMAQMEHPFLIKLWATFNDRDRLYLLLEPSLGGELFTRLRGLTMFDEETAKFYAGCVVLAFEYMHSLNFIYRDLKPENLLIHDDGYLKVTDFGFAKDISAGRTWTVCGTPDYLAPEIIQSKGHGKGVDWWTVGILIFEMLASHPPFCDEDPMKVYRKIVHDNLTFPSSMSKEAQNLITKLLERQATRRLGVLKGGAKLIKKHSWFASIDLEELEKKKITAPYVPRIRGVDDLSNFGDANMKAEDIPEYIERGDEVWDNF